MIRRVLLGTILLVMSMSIVTAQSEESVLVNALLDRMEDAVLEGNAAIYLSYVDLSDPIFAREHTNWANEWADENYLTDFDLDATNIRTANGETIADLTMRWESTLDENPGMVARFTAQFTVDTEMGIALYGGEYWERMETEHFVVLSAEGQDEAVENLLPELPDIYTSVTEAYGYEPNTQMQIKLYETPEALIATTLLSLPPIGGWNEPGESLKIIDADPESDGLIVAHEFTHFLTFNQAGDTHGNIPWWASEGIAEYMAQHYLTDGEQTYAESTVGSIRQFAERNNLVAWEEISVFEETPVELWRYVYPQGYTFMHFLTEVHGAEARNTWLHNLAHNMEMDEATEAVFSMSFESLDREFVLWLLGGDSPDA